MAARKRAKSARLKLPPVALAWPFAYSPSADGTKGLVRFAAHAPGPFDCMLEAKEKERALLRLRAALGRRSIRETDLNP